MTILFVRQFFPQAPPFDGLRWAIASARRFSPGSRVILLGDERQPTNLCEYHNLKDYSETADRIGAIYQHRHTSPEFFIKCSILGWCYVYDFWKKHNLDRVVVLDTDVLTFADLDRECQHWQDVDMTMSHPEGHVQGPMIINNVTALEAYISLLTDCYSGKAPDGVFQGPECTMTFWRHVARLNPFRVGDTSEIKNGATWDHNLCQGYHNYEHNGVSKVMRFHNFQPYCLRGNDLVRFNILHCWGYWKNRMAELARHGGVSA